MLTDDVAAHCQLRDRGERRGRSARGSAAGPAGHQGGQGRRLGAASTATGRRRRDRRCCQGEYELSAGRRRTREHAAPLPGGAGLVVLDTAVTPELAAEGLARDVVRVVQQARRDAGLDVSDRITLTVDGAGRRCSTRSARTRRSWPARCWPRAVRYAAGAGADPGRHRGRRRSGRPRSGCWSRADRRGPGPARPDRGPPAPPGPAARHLGPRSSGPVCHRSARWTEGQVRTTLKMTSGRTGGWARRGGGASCSPGGGSRRRSSPAPSPTRGGSRPPTSPRRPTPPTPRPGAAGAGAARGRRLGARRRLWRRRGGVRAGPAGHLVIGRGPAAGHAGRLRRPPPRAAASRTAPCWAAGPSRPPAAGPADVVVCHHVLHNVVELPAVPAALARRGAPRRGRRDARRAPDGLAGPALGAVPRPAPPAVGHRRRRGGRAAGAGRRAGRHPLGAGVPAPPGPALGHPPAVPAGGPDARGGRRPATGWTAPGPRPPSPGRRCRGLTRGLRGPARIQFGMASLEVLLGVAAAVVLLGVLAVRVSVRLGLPSLLLYLGIGLLLGESVLGIQFSDAAAHRVARAGRARAHPRRGRADHPLDRGPARARGRHRAVHGGRGGEHRRWSGWRCTCCSAWTGGTRSSGARCCPRPTRRPCSACCAGSGCRRAAVRHAGARVRDERRAGGARRRAAGLRRPDHLGDPAAGRSTSWSRARVIGGLFGLGGAWALRRAALPSTGLYPLAAIAVCVLAYSTGQFAHASGLLATYVAALVLGNSDLPHRGGVRSFAEGTGLAGPDRAVRAARAVRLAAPAGRRGGPGPGRGAGAAAGWRGRCRCSPPRRRSGCRGGNRCSCPGPGCAARCPSCSR